MRTTTYLMWTCMIAVPMVIWNGFALSLVWKWFMSDVFHLPEITIAQAIGLAIVAGFFVQIKDTDDIHNEERLFKLAVGGTMKPGFLLLLGWIVSLLT